MNILLIEDDRRVAESVAQGLGEEGYEVAVCRTRADADAHLDQSRPDLVLLDLGLPDGDGLDVLRRLRGDMGALPVLILTARDEIEDRVAGLDLGADDYLVKPFAFPELLARIRALARRAQGGEALMLKVADLEVDVVRRTATRAGAHLDLTQREFELLAYLARSAGKVVSRQMLAKDVWKVTARATPMDNVIDVHISHLRGKLDGKSETPLLRTVRGVGFVLGEAPAPS